jgi:3-deoxy-D-arabino-heptulosonate 7-phosphate (DAHP) synthase class II
MEPETETVIDVEAEQIDSSSPESIDQWYSAAQVQGALNLNKAALQKAIAKLTNIYSIDLKFLRRGSARATEYSQLAMDVIELLNAGSLASSENW